VSRNLALALGCALFSTIAVAQGTTDATPPCAIMSFSAAINIATIEFASCTTPPPKVALKSGAIVKIGDAQIPSAVVDVSAPVDFGGVLSQTITVEPTSAAGTRNFQPADGPEYSGDAASVIFTLADGTTTEIPVTLGNPVSHSEHTAHVGQATADNLVSTTTDPSGPDAAAFRFQYDGAYVVFPPASDAAQKWWDRGVQQEYALSIDTTNQKNSAFTDDNQASAGVYLPRFNLGSLLNRARVGVQGVYSRALHSASSTFDGKVTFEGWLPFFQVQSLFSKDRFAAPPLSFNVGWGYRDQKSEGSIGGHGSVFDGTVAYHLYLLDQYRVDFEYRTLVNDVDNRPPNTSRTEHTWKASVLMSPKPGSAFSAVVSYENGHAGPVFTKVRQYFVGIGLERLFDKK
jgi:hypothetical protein